MLAYDRTYAREPALHHKRLDVGDVQKIGSCGCYSKYSFVYQIWSRSIFCIPILVLSSFTNFKFVSLQHIRKQCWKIRNITIDLRVLGLGFLSVKHSWFSHDNSYQALIILLSVYHYDWLVLWCVDIRLIEDPLFVVLVALVQIYFVTILL